MEEFFGKRVNYAGKISIQLEYLIEQFWEIFNDTRKIINQKKKETENILEQVEIISQDDQSRFYNSKNPENSNQSVSSCLRLLGVAWDNANRGKTEEVTLKTSRSMGVFSMEDEDPVTDDAHSPDTGQRYGH